MITPIRAASIRTLHAQMRNSALSAIVTSVYMVTTAAPFSPWRRVAGWAAVYALSQAWREWHIRLWRQKDREDQGLEIWARAYTLYMAVGGMLWGSTIYLFAQPEQPITVALVMCCLYSVAAGSVPTNAYNPPGLIALVGFMFLPIVVRLVATGSFVYIMLGIASGLYAIAMFGMCRVQARALNDGFKIRFENDALLEQLRQKTEQAEAARQRAELASLAKSQFLAAASHDLRQPLYALSLFSASLEELRLDADGRAVVGKIQDSIQVMEQLFDGLLDLSKLEAGVVQVHLGAVSIDALFDRLSQYFRPIALERGLDLRFRNDGEWVNSDPVLLEQVLGNLVSNALRCTVAGGVLVAARRRAGRIRLEVWDTGIGIAPDDAARIFDEFVQIGNAERDRRKGLGLGLSIARRSGALIGAVIDVASRPGRGSCFGFSQPVAQAPAATADGRAPIKAPVSYPALPRPRDLPLLVIDDDRAVREALADLLGRWGVRFDTAADGAAALALVDQGTRYGLVIADYRLPPPWNGLDLLAAIAARHGDTPPSGALVTADFDPGLMAAARAAGVPLIPKPVRPAQLRQVLGV